MSLPLRACLLLAVLAATALAGCSNSPEPAAPANDGPLPSLVRHVRLNLSAADFMAPARTPEAQLAKAHVAFDYTHHGATVNLADVKIRYLTVDGAQSVATFSGLSNKTVLNDGDTVVFELPTDASTLSFVRLDLEGDVFASRDGVRVDWFTMGDLPIPLAMDGPGLASYSLLAQSFFELKGNGLEFATPGNLSCSPDGCAPQDVMTRIDDLNLTFSSTATASLELRSSVEQRQRRVSFAVNRSEVETNVGLKLRAMLANTSFDFALSGKTVDQATGFVDFTFNKDGEMTAYGTQGDTSTRKNYTSRGLPEELAEMFPAQDADQTSQPYLQQPLDLAGAGDASLVAFLDRLWSMDVRPGDTFAFHWEDSAARVDYTSSVGKMESRDIGDAPRDTYPVSDRLHISLKDTNIPREFDYTAQSWIDPVTFLPIYVQATVTQTIRAIDYPELRDAVEENLTAAGDKLLRWMDNGVVTLRTSVLLSMGHDDGNLTHAAVLEAGASRLLPILAAASMQNAIGPFVPGGRPDIPELTFRADEDEDRILVQAASQGARWDRVAVVATSCSADAGVTVDIGSLVVPHQNRPADDIEGHAPVSTPGCASPQAPLDVSITRTPIFAADYLAFCAAGGPASNVAIDLVDKETDYVMATLTLKTVDACA